MPMSWLLPPARGRRPWSRRADPPLRWKFCSKCCPLWTGSMQRFGGQLVTGKSAEASGVPQDFESLRSVIVLRREELPRRLGQVAEFALEHPDKVAFGTVAELAGLAGVQPSTLVRFRPDPRLCGVFRSAGDLSRPAARPLAGLRRAPEAPGGACPALDVITIGRASVDLYGQQIGSRLEDIRVLRQVGRRLPRQHRHRHGAAGAEAALSPASATSRWAASSASSWPRGRRNAPASSPTPSG
jgi:hypothetical protein